MNYKIPEGAKEISVTETEGKIVVEFVQDVLHPKKGDVCINERGSVYVFKTNDGDRYHEFYAGIMTDSHIVDTCGCYIAGRLATNQEAQKLWDALKKEGKRWNAEKMCVEEITEKERIGEFVLSRYRSSYVYTFSDIVNVIEAYLKEREGE